MNSTGTDLKKLSKEYVDFWQNALSYPFMLLSPGFCEDQPPKKEKKSFTEPDFLTVKTQL
jgi:hypothetical protein